MLQRKWAAGSCRIFERDLSLNVSLCVWKIVWNIFDVIFALLILWTDENLLFVRAKSLPSSLLYDFLFFNFFWSTAAQMKIGTLLLLPHCCVFYWIENSPLLPSDSNFFEWFLNKSIDKSEWGNGRQKANEYYAQLKIDSINFLTENFLFDGKYT